MYETPTQKMSRCYPDGEYPELDALHAKAASVLNFVELLTDAFNFEYKTDYSVEFILRVLQVAAQLDDSLVHGD